MVTGMTRADDLLRIVHHRDLTFFGSFTPACLSLPASFGSFTPPEELSPGTKSEPSEGENPCPTLQIHRAVRSSAGEHRLCTHQGRLLLAYAHGSQ